MNDAISLSFVTAIITVIISFFIAFVVKIMTVVLHKFTKESNTATIASEVVESSDESEIAAVIAIAKSKQ